MFVYLAGIKTYLFINPQRFCRAARCRWFRPLVVKAARVRHPGRLQGNSWELKNMENLVPHKSSFVQLSLVHFGKEPVYVCPHGDFTLFCNSFPWQQFGLIQPGFIDMPDNASTVKRKRERDPDWDLSEIATVHCLLKSFLLPTSVAISLPQKKSFLSQKGQNRCAANEGKVRTDLTQVSSHSWTEKGLCTFSIYLLPSFLLEIRSWRARETKTHWFNQVLNSVLIKSPRKIPAVARSPLWFLKMKQAKQASNKYAKFGTLSKLFSLTVSSNPYLRSMMEF